MCSQSPKRKVMEEVGNLPVGRRGRIAKSRGIIKVVLLLTRPKTMRVEAEMEEQNLDRN